MRLELRDFDHAVIGAPAHDVCRLAFSLAVEAVASGLSAGDVGAVVGGVCRGYDDGLKLHAERRRGSSNPVRRVLKAARRRDRAALLDETFGRADEIPLGARFWALTPAERGSVEAIVAEERTRALVVTATDCGDAAHVELLDAAYWVKGCSSLGAWRGIALLRASRPGGGSERVILDFKEARTPTCPTLGGGPANPAARVVAAARVLSADLGDRMIASEVLGTPVFVRELRAEDLKIELTEIDRRDAVAVGEQLGEIVGIAHARQLRDGDAERWRAELSRACPRPDEPPEWLWAAIVDLIGDHQSAYLRHGQRVATR